MNKDANLLKFGDCLILSVSQGYVVSQGFTKPSCYVQVNFSKSHVYNRNMRDFVFQVYPRMNYDAFKEHRKFQKQMNKLASQLIPQSQQDKIKMSNLNKKLMEEVNGNRKTFQRRKGENVAYGDEIQLLHYDSKSFLEASKNCAEVDRSCNMVKLNRNGGKMVCFIVEPRYKYRNEGQSVNYNDVVVFKNIKCNQYLHISTRHTLLPKGRTKSDIKLLDPDNFKNIVYSQIDRRMLPDEFAPLFEINTSSNRSNFTIKPYRTYLEEEEANLIKGGQVVRFQHSESNSFLSSDDSDFTGDNLAEVFLWNFKGKSTDIEALSTQTLFELEIVDIVDSGLGRVCQYSGNCSNETAKSGGMHFRLRHLNTGRLVVMQEIVIDDEKVLTVGLSDHLHIDIQITTKGLNSKCHLTSSNPEYMAQLEANSIFRLVSTGIDEQSGITQNTSVQIQHVASKRFLTADTRKFGEAKEEVSESGELEGENAVVKSDVDVHEDQEQQIKSPAVPLTEKEQLDERFFQEIEHKYIDLGSRDLLTLEEQATFENAFFITPEPRESLAKVLFVHTSVNCLNNLLTEISDRNFGESKERQAKIEGIVIEMINWLMTDEEGQIDGDEDKYQMDLPYDLKNNDEFDRKRRGLQIKQKYMRELRVVECIVDILHMPFASGQFNFMELTQDMAIISLLKCCYKLLSLIVKDYRLNEMYTSQWIGLFLNHVLQANDDNAVGADNFVSQLCDENDVILEKMITTHIIQEFIRQCDKGKEAPRLLSLLTALCASQNGPIVQNQRDCVQFLCDDIEQRKKLLMPLRRIKQRYEIEVCLDLNQERWVHLYKVCEQYKQVNRRYIKALQQDADAVMSSADQAFMIDFQCLKQTLDLFAETCLHRNKTNQKRLTEFYEAKILIAIFQDPRMNYAIRSKSLKLYLEACLDIDPFQKLQVPSGLAVWKDLPQLDFSGKQLEQAIMDKQIEQPIKFSKVRIPNRILDLKVFMEQYLRTINGVIDSSDMDQDRNEMTIQVLKTVKFMISHGFYKTTEELAKISSPIVQLLNGGSSVKKKKATEEQDADLEETQCRQRYFPESQGDPQILSKCLAADILLFISNLESDAKCQIYLAKLKRDIEINPDFDPNAVEDAGNQFVADQPQGVSCKEDLELLATVAAVKGYEAVNEQQYVCVLFDLLLYRYTELQQKAFKMLVNYFIRNRIMIECLTQTQILESSKSVKTLNEIKSAYNELRIYLSDISFWLANNNQKANQQKIEVTMIFDKLAKFCIEKDAEVMIQLEQQFKNRDELQKSVSSMTKRTTTVDWEKRLKQKKNQIEEFFIFDIDKDNAHPNKENQRLIANFEIADICLAIIKFRVDRITNSRDEYKELIKSCYRFLIAYIRNNFQGQLKVYDDVDIFMRDMDSYFAATLLFYEIFKNNTKFLTLNVTKFIRTVNNIAEEVSLSQVKKAVYLKLLEVFCRFENQLIRQNQNEIIAQMTADTTRSNVLYLFQPEGSKELNGHIEDSQRIKQSLTDSMSQIEEPANKSLAGKSPTSPEGKKKLGETPTRSEQTGIQEMSICVFNVIQLLQLISLTCQGKSDYAEIKCKEVLNFSNAANIIKMSNDFWPLKIAVFDYIIHAYLDSSDPNFMAKPTDDEQDADDEPNDNKVDESDVGVLLTLISIMINDYEAYLAGDVKQTILKMPNGNKIPMKQLCEDYIYGTGFQFIKSTLIRKKYDVGSVELKFYQLMKRIAETFYHTNDRKQQRQAFDIINYLYNSNHAKYLDNVRHPAKKGRANSEIQAAFAKDRELEETVVEKVAELTNSSRLSQRITQLANHNQMKLMKEAEFTQLVQWVIRVDENVKQHMPKQMGSVYSNLTYNNIISSLLRLLDAKVLSKELQIAGLSILRKIIEQENTEMSTPAADWNTEDWCAFQRIIIKKQGLMIERGTISFLCKHISEQEDADIQEECLLVCISLVLGGNNRSQEAFFYYMQNEDPENRFLMTIKAVLMRNFESTKKYMIEKNAKLEMIYKMRMRDKHTSQTSTSKQAKQTHTQRKGLLGRCRSRKVEDEADSLVTETPILPESEGLQYKNNSGEEGGEQAQESEEDLLKIDVEDEDEEEEADADEQKVEKPVSVEELEENTKKKYLAMTIRILRFLQLLCEGHYANLQNNLREQQSASGVKSSRSFDFVAYVSNIFTIYVKSYVNKYSTELGNQIIETLIELIQGPCRPNQRTLVDTKSIDCCRDLLNQGMGNVQELEVKGFNQQNKSLLNDIKMNSVKLLLSILEGPVDQDISARISASLGDYKIVIKRMETIYYQFLEEVLCIPPDSSLAKIQKSLKKDSFDSFILEGFDIFSLLNQLVEVLPDEKPKLQAFKDESFFQFYVKNSGNIEVMTQFDVLRIYYPLQPKCQFLTEKTKQKFSLNVERESGQHKLIGLCEYIPSFIEEMEHLEVMSHHKIQITPALLTKIQNFSTILAVSCGFLIVFGYQYDFIRAANGSQDYISNIASFLDDGIFILGAVQAVSSFMLLVGFIVNSANLIVRAGWRQRVQQNELDMAIEIKQLQAIREQSVTELGVGDMTIEMRRVVLQVEGPYSPLFYNDVTGVRNFGGMSLLFEYYWISLTFLISNNSTLFNVMYFVFSIQGLLQSPVFYSFHLLDVVNRSPPLQNVIKSVTLNVDQILLTGMLGFILMYNFAIFAFLFLSDNFYDANINAGLLNKNGDSVCMSLLHCFFSTMTYGLRFGGGVAELQPQQTSEEWNQANYFLRFFFDIAFFIVIITIILNVVFGIIIDSFAQLRENDNFRDLDIKNNCFICNLDRYTLDRDTEQGFEHHCETDHFLWNYVFFIIHLKQKDASDQDGTESYINSQLEREDMSWFPQHKSLRMNSYLKLKQKHEVVEEAGELDLLQEQFDKLNEVVSKFEAMES